MRIVILGAGALGSLIGGGLARIGCDVILLGRDPHIKAIREEGLRITGLQDYTIRVSAITQPQTLDACDLLVVTVKTHDTAKALHSVEHLAAQTVVSFQNSVTKDAQLADVFGPERVLGGASILAGQRTGPGVVTWTFDGGTRVGELDGTVSDRSKTVVDMMCRAGFDARVSASVVSDEWSKFVGWVPLGLLSLVTRLSNSEVLSEPSLAELYVKMIRELRTLTRARQMPLQDFGPYLSQTLGEGTLEEAVSRVVASPLAQKRHGVRGTMHSMLQDVLAGRVSELNGCIGPLMAEAEQRELAMPATQVIFNLARAVEASL